MSVEISNFNTKICHVALYLAFPSAFYPFPKNILILPCFFSSVKPVLCWTQIDCNSVFSRKFLHALKQCKATPVKHRNRKQGQDFNGKYFLYFYLILFHITFPAWPYPSITYSLWTARDNVTCTNTPGESKRHSFTPATVALLKSFQVATHTAQLSLIYPIREGQ